MSLGPAHMKQMLQTLSAMLLRPLGVRLVNAGWGPRGFARTFEMAKRAGFDPATIIDVGASDGMWSAECMSVFPGANYALFDALPQNASKLAAFAGSRSNVRYWCGALGPEAGELQFNVHGDQSSFLASAEFPGTRLPVEVRPLDSFIGEMAFKGPMLLKADVQGFELEVLRGAGRCLEMTEALMLEVSFRRLYDGCPLAHDVIGELGARGYRIYDIASYAQRPHDGALAQSDIIFVKDGSKLFSHEGWR